MDPARPTRRDWDYWHQGYLFGGGAGFLLAWFFLQAFNVPKILFVAAGLLSIAFGMGEMLWRAFYPRKERDV